ncbi:hypothetical protein [Luethyella okanaganae]|uniref:Uncharacterized protein n=1 Tax=Luethyella okanaganae TaxID=69372 RepID=A0ABW1VIA7_9MICO
MWDIQHPLAEVSEGDEYPLTWVEVALIDLDDDIQQELDDKLELLDPVDGAVSSDPLTAELGARIRYCVQYRPADDSLEHWVEYVRTGVRVPRVHREMLQAIIIDRADPLQLRVEGAFRALAASQDADRLIDAIGSFGEDIGEATDTLAQGEAVRSALEAMSKNGATFALGVDQKRFVEGVGFVAEDGSISGLLRAIRPTLDIDDAGALPLTSHGSTTPAVLAIVEALAASRMDHRIVIIDDFGDSLDSASTDFMARLLSRSRNQIWLSSRRAEALGAFEPEHLIRLTRHSGALAVHQLAPTNDRRERVSRRYLPPILSGAMSSRTLILVEGPHDLEGYAALDRKRLADDSKVPLSARGAQIVAASTTGGDGGKSRLPILARLGVSLGFEVRVVVDSDKPGEDEDLINELVDVCDLVIVLPMRTAVERALVRGLPAETLRSVLDQLNEEHDLGLDLESVDDGDLEKVLVKALKQKGGLHRLYVPLLPKGEHPPIALDVLNALKAPLPTTTRIDISEP